MGRIAAFRTAPGAGSANIHVVGSHIRMRGRLSGYGAILLREPAPGFIDLHDHTIPVDDGDLIRHGVDDYS